MCTFTKPQGRTEVVQKTGLCNVSVMLLWILWLEGVASPNWKQHQRTHFVFNQHHLKCKYKPASAWNRTLLHLEKCDCPEEGVNFKDGMASSYHKMEKPQTLALTEDNVFKQSTQCEALLHSRGRPDSDPLEGPWEYAEPAQNQTILISFHVTFSKTALKKTEWADN